MQINITVENPDLSSTIPEPYGDDTTLGALVAANLTREFKQTGGWDGIQKRFEDLRDEEIRAQVAPIVAEAIHNPITKSNRYGEPTGDTTTLREIIATEARKALTNTGDSYSSKRESLLVKTIRAEVHAALTTEIKDVVKKVRNQVIDQISETAKDQITAAALDALKSR